MNGQSRLTVKRLKGYPNRSQHGFVGRRTLAAFLFCAASVCLLGMAIPLGLMFSSPNAPEKASSRSLTFERAAYQRAIEEVYWRHRIWPKENARPKPALDAVISQAQIEQKVKDYLRKSQLIVDQRGRPITASELQAEMERMASHTLHPRVLLELFQALDNDPFVIAECLARPLVAERLGNELGRQGGVQAFAAANAKALTAATALTSQSYKLPQISVPLDCTDDTWTAITTVNAPQARGTIGRGVWTGSEMIIWGGSNGTGLNTGGRYDPSTDTWTATSTTNAPTARGSHTLVWTGTEMIVWGATSSWLAIRTPAADIILSLIAG